MQRDRRSKTNHLCWDMVKLNLPGDIKTYDPMVSWVKKMDLTTNNTAHDFVIYYDDVRLVGHGEHNCAQMMHWVGSVLNHLG
eukprot:3247243-Ditylum_brightwellii.AAC.1